MTTPPRSRTTFTNTSMLAIGALLTTLTAACVVEPYEESMPEDEITETAQDELKLFRKKKKPGDACLDVVCPVVGCTKQCICPSTNQIYNCGCRTSGNGTNGENCDLLADLDTDL